MMKRIIAKLRVPVPMAYLATLLCAVTILILLLCGCYDRTMSRSKSSGTQDQILGEDCSECHTAVWEEWRNSPHAKAFISNTFREMTNEYQFKPCLSCHAPKTIFSDRLEARKSNREEGVNCVSCHLLGNKIQSAKVYSSFCPHPVGEKSDYSRAELCGKCHKRAFDEWQSWIPLSTSISGDSGKNGKSPPPKKTCQECHMPIVERKTIQERPWALLHPVKKLRGHAFTTFDEDILEKAAIMSVPPEDFKEYETNGHLTIKGTIVIQINEVGHSIPTGDYGYREAALVIALKDKFGISRNKKVESFFVEDGTALKPGKPKEISFDFHDFSTDVTAIEITLLRVPFSGAEGTEKVISKMNIYWNPAFK